MQLGVSAKSDIDVFPGKDPDVLKRNEASEITNVSGVTVDGLMDLIRDLYFEELERAPQLLRDNAPRSIPIYGIPGHQSHAGRVELGKTEAVLSTFSVGNVPYVFPTQMELPKGLEGIFINTTAKENIQRNQGILAHELRHVINRFACSSAHEGMYEGFNGGFDVMYQRENFSAEIYSDAAHSNNAAFCSFGFTRIQRSKGYSEALYNHAKRCFLGIDEQHQWAIQQKLTEQALETDYFPPAEQIRKIVLEVLQKNGEPIIQNPLFRDADIGPQIHAFYNAQQQNGRAILSAFTLSLAKPTPPVNMELMSSGDMKIGIAASLQNRDGQEMFKFNIPIAGTKNIAATSLKDAILRSLPQLKGACDDAKTIELSIPNIAQKIMIQ